jgi:hypothetical protein
MYFHQSLSNPANPMNITYDEKHALSYGKWRCPECGATSYALTDLRHREGCISKPFSNGLDFLVGDKAIRHANGHALIAGEDDDTGLLPFSLATLKKALPAVIIDKALALT